MDDKHNNNLTHVFQCINCLTIISDNRYCIDNFNDLYLIFDACSNYEFSNEIFTSDQEIDLGCAYSLLICNKCHTSIGKWYTSTSSQFDHLRNKFILDINQIVSYNLNQNISHANQDPNEQVQYTLSDLNEKNDKNDAINMCIS